MENFDPNFIDQAWQNMQQQLNVAMPQKQKRRFVLWYFAIAAALVSAVACAFMYNTKHDETVTQNVTTQQQKIQKREQFPAKIASPTSQITDASIVADAKLKTSKTNQLEKVKTVQKQIESKFLNIKNTDNQSVINKNLILNSNFNPSIPEKQELSATNILLTNEVSETLKSTENKEKETNIAYLTSTIKNIESQDQNFVFYPNFQFVNAIKKAKKPFRIGYDVYARSLVTRGFNDGFQLGLDATHEFNDVWKISAGLQFQRYNLYYKTIESVCTNCDLTNNNGKADLITLGQNVPGSSAFIYANNTIINPHKANRFSVPLMISYRVFEELRFNLGINLNLTQSLNLDKTKINSGQLYTSDNTFEKSIQATSPYNFTQDANLGASYTFFKKWTIDAGFQFQNNLAIKNKKIQLAPNYLGNALGQQQYTIFYVGAKYKIK
jgi:hypothetical protein